MNPANYSAISFPFLNLELNPPRTFQLGPLTVHFYGLIIAIGLLLAVAYCSRRSFRAGLTSDDILDGVLWIAPFSILCARAYYCIFSWDMYRDNPISVLYIWNGGLAIYGAVIGAVIGVLVFCRVKKCRVTALLDLVAMGFLIGQIMGRWGNFFNREAFGAATDSFFRMGLFNTVTGQWEYYHPTFLYESLWNLVGFAVLHFAYPRKKYDGQIALSYAAWYGLGRAMIEGLRMDSLYLGSIRVSQLLAAVTCLLSVAALLWQAFRSHAPEDLFMNVVKRRAEEGSACGEAPLEEVATEEVPPEEVPSEEVPEKPEE